MGNVLIIDDDELFCEMLSEMVTDMGHGVKFTHSLDEGVVEAANGDYDVVFLDVRMPDGSGLRALPKIREMSDPPEVIIITGAGDPDGAELAIINGTWDYIEKQSSIKRMTLPLVRALQYREEKKSRKPAVALRDHLEDIKELVVYHTGKLCESHGIPQKGFAPEFFECLLTYDWPGNIRELINTLDRAIAEARHEPTLYPNHLPGYIRAQAVRNTVTRETPELSRATAAAAGVNLPKLREYREAAVARAERKYLQELMVLANNDLQEACRISGLSKPRLYALLKKHGISREKSS